METKGQLFNIFTFMIAAIMVVFLFGGWVYIHGQLNNVFHAAGVINDNTFHPNSSMPCIDDQTKTCYVSTYTNMTAASDMTFGQIAQSSQALKIVAVVYILSFGMFIVLSNFFVKYHPFFFFVYILISLLAVIMSVPIANSYHNIYPTIYDGTLLSWTTANWLVERLPTIVMVISILGAIALFLNIIRTGGEGDIMIR
jgi:hypothetical protein